MTITFSEIWFYIFAQLVLVLSPGPVVAALIARVLSQGLQGAMPIALAVFIGDMFWVSIAIFGASALIANHENLLHIIRIGGAICLVYLGIQEIRHASAEIDPVKLAKTSKFWPNFAAGLVIIMTNPKAALFYMLFVPQFFDMPALSGVDIAFIVVLSGLVPFIGNMIWAGTAQIASNQIRSPKGRARLRIISGISLILVAILLVFLH